MTDTILNHKIEKLTQEIRTANLIAFAQLMFNLGIRSEQDLQTIAKRLTNENEND